MVAVSWRKRLVGDLSWRRLVVSGRALYETARGPKRHLWVAGAGHNDVQDYAGPAWGRTIAEFAASIAGKGRRSGR